MRKHIWVLFLLISSGTGFAQSSILVDADWVNRQNEEGDIIIFHISREENYNKEHIPGATFISHREYTFDDEEKDLVFDRPSDSVLKDLFEAKGVGNDKEVVIYTNENWIPLVTRLYFTLDYLGHGDKTHILDGGLAAWKASGYEVTAEVTSPERSDFRIKPNPNVLADLQYMKASVEDKGNTILDCRSEVYYNGIQATHGARSGRIPGARSIPFTSLYEASDIGGYAFKTLPELKGIFLNQGLTEKEPLVLYCHIGMQLTVVYTVAKILGYKDVRMYDGSMHEWGKSDSLPMETE